MSFCKEIYDEIHESEKAPLTKNIIKEYLTNCFKDYVHKLPETLGMDFWNIVRICELKEWNKTSESSYNSTSVFIKEVADIFKKEVLPRYTDEILIACIVPDDWYGNPIENDKVGISKFITNVLGGLRPFVEYVSSDNFKASLINPSKFLEEFIDFSKGITKEHQRISFKFKYQPVIDKLNLKKNSWGKSF